MEIFAERRGAGPGSDKQRRPLSPTGNPRLDRIRLPKNERKGKAMIMIARLKEQIMEATAGREELLLEILE